MVSCPGLWLSAVARAASSAQLGPTESLGSGQARCSCDSRVARQTAVEAVGVLAGPCRVVRRGQTAVRHGIEAGRRRDSQMCVSKCEDVLMLIATQ